MEGRARRKNKGVEEEKMKKEDKETLRELAETWEGSDFKPIALAVHSYELGRHELLEDIKDMLFKDLNDLKANYAIENMDATIDAWYKKELKDFEEKEE